MAAGTLLSANVLVLLLAVGGGEECRPFVCKSAALGTCATLTSSYISIQPCPGDLTCDYFSSILPYLNYTDYTAYCQHDSEREHPFTIKGMIDIVDTVCNSGVTSSTPRLVEQSTFKECVQDQECLLTNGSYTACACGLNGKRYCRYGPGDEVFVNLTNAACTKDWNQYLLMAALAAMQGDAFSYPDCMPDILADYSYYNYLKNGGDVYRLFGTPTQAAFLAPLSLLFL